MIVNKIKDGYTQIPNKLITGELSDKAKITFCYLASKPTGWEFYNADIMKNLKIGQQKTIASKMKELINAGWISREKVTKEIAKEKNLKSGTYIYTIYGEPNLAKSQISSKAKFGKKHIQSNTDLINNTDNPPYRLVSTKEEKGQEDKVLVDFNLFYSEYPKKKAKAAALKIFTKKYKKMPPVNKLIEIIDICKKTEEWKKENGKFIPYPSTWLNQERWQDEIEVTTGDSWIDEYPWMKDVPEG